TGSGRYRDGVSYVVIDHGGGWATRYLHMEVRSQAKTGTTVRQGDRIGKVSDVGSPGAYHLHYEQRRGREIVAARFNGVAFAYPRQNITSKNCRPSSAESGDWNGDGKPDVLARQTSTGTVVLHKGNGNAAFKPGSSQAGTGWTGMNAILRHGDWDGDRHEDVLATETATGDLFLYRGTGKGTFKTGRTRIDNGWNTYTPIAAGDFDGDSHNDLLGKHNTTGHLFLYRGTGTGGLAAGSTRIGTGWMGYDQITGVGDFDGDGDNDLVAREKSTGHLFLYRGTGTGGL
ncbi:FG-GAP-like repeat-containing protein, partial [Streptomyces jumonjinensis]